MIERMDLAFQRGLRPTPAQDRLLARLPDYVTNGSRTGEALVAAGLARWMKRKGRFRTAMIPTPQGREALRVYEAGRQARASVQRKRTPCSR